MLIISGNNAKNSLPYNSHQV